MRKIKIETWKARIADGTELDENLLMALNVLIGNKRPEEIPKGLDKFRLFSRLSTAFEKAEKDGVLSLEESDYEFLKNMVEKDIPSTWGLNKKLGGAIEAFLTAKQE